ncbi:FRG domain-containing protein [Dermabacteraceae bacterium P7006]
METLAEKFFLERDLKVTEIATAQSWFDAVGKAISPLPKYNHGAMGMGASSNSDIDSSSSDNEHESVGSDGDGVWFFRGQKDISFAFNSTLYRRLISSSSRRDRPRDCEEAMVAAELALLAKAKEVGIGRGLTALETLTLLQHHGSPTRLIDVTSDWKVALFFACENSDSKDGRIFLLRISPNRWRDFPKADGKASNEPIWADYKKNFVKNSGMVENYSWLSGVWPVLLPFSDPRMIAQKGFFLVGGIPSLKGKAHLNTGKCKYCTEKLCSCGKGDQYGNKSISLTTQQIREVTSLSIRFGADKSNISDLAEIPRAGKWTAIGYSIKVPAKFKPELREILREEGIHEDSMYPPLRETVRLFEHVVIESFNAN